MIISIPGFLSFAKLVIMSSATAKSAGDARCTSQDPFIHSLIVPHNLDSKRKKIMSAFFLCQSQLLSPVYRDVVSIRCFDYLFLLISPQKGDSRAWSQGVKDKDSYGVSQ